MIAQLTGTVAHVGASSCVLDVGGVGYQVLSTPRTLADLRRGSDATMYTCLVVREDSMTLFGFADAGERQTFELLQSVQGVGPKLALAMLSVHTPESLTQAVQQGDAKALEKVPGVGAKVAARLLLELGGKLVLPHDAAAAAPGDARAQVLDALVSLGWNVKAAQGALDKVAPEPIAEAAVAETLRLALQHMGGARG